MMILRFLNIFLEINVREKRENRLYHDGHSIFRTHCCKNFFNSKRMCSQNCICDVHGYWKIKTYNYRKSWRTSKVKELEEAKPVAIFQEKFDRSELLFDDKYKYKEATRKLSTLDCRIYSIDYTKEVLVALDSALQI